MEGFESETELEKYFRRGLKNNSNDSTGWGAVVFDDGVSEENQKDFPDHHTFSYKIRLEDTGGGGGGEYGAEDTGTGVLVPSLQKPGPNQGFKKYRHASSCIKSTVISII